VEQFSLDQERASWQGPDRGDGNYAIAREQAHGSRDASSARIVFQTSPIGASGNTF
jgi:hypothetical protein